MLDEWLLNSKFLYEGEALNVIKRVRNEYSLGCKSIDAWVDYTQLWVTVVEPDDPEQFYDFVGTLVNECAVGRTINVLRKQSDTHRIYSAVIDTTILSAERCCRHDEEIDDGEWVDDSDDYADEEPLTGRSADLTKEK